MSDIMETLAMNDSDAIHASDTSPSIPGVSMIAITSILSIVCNILNLLILPKLAEINEASRVLYVALSLVDLVTGFLLIPMAVASVKGEWPFGDALCKSLGYFLTITTGLSSSTVFFLNGDRFIAVTKPLRYPSFMNRNRAIMIIVSNTIGSAIIMFFILFFGGDQFNIVVFREFGICMVDFSEPYFAPFTIFSFAVSMWAYAALLLIFYTVILRIVRRHTTAIANQEALTVQPSSVHGEETRSATDIQKDIEKAGKRARERQFRGQIKSILLAVAIAGTFYISWLPFTICEAVAALRGKKISTTILIVASRLTLSNSWLNTVIYMLLKPSYRNATVQICRSMRDRLCTPN